MRLNKSRPIWPLLLAQYSPCRVLKRLGAAYYHLVLATKFGPQIPWDSRGQARQTSLVNAVQMAHGLAVELC